MRVRVRMRVLKNSQGPGSEGYRLVIAVCLCFVNVVCEYVNAYANFKCVVAEAMSQMSFGVPNADSCRGAKRSSTICHWLSRTNAIFINRSMSSAIRRRCVLLSSTRITL